MSVITPSQNQLLEFLRAFRADGNEKTYDQDETPYPDDPESAFLLAYCIQNGYIDQAVRNRFRDISVGYLGEGLLLAGKSPAKLAKLWIEDHPSLWGAACATGGYLLPFVHELIRKILT